MYIDSVEMGETQCSGGDVAHRHCQRTEPTTYHSNVDEPQQMQWLETGKNRVVYRVETPPESPKTDGMREKMTRESGLSPYLNKMSLKRLKEGYEEEIDRRYVRSKGGEVELRGSDKVASGGAGEGGNGKQSYKWEERKLIWQ